MLAGYQATPIGGLASASVTFTLPTMSCTANDTALHAQFYAGVYADTLDAEAVANGYCSPTGPAYAFALATGGSAYEGSAAAGDVVVASLFQSRSSTYAEIHDMTNNEYWSIDDPNPVFSDTAIDIGTYSAQGTDLPTPTFAKVKFTNATVNGDYLGFDSPSQFNRASAGVLLIKSGKLTTTATGSAFSDTFKKAAWDS